MLTFRTQRLGSCGAKEKHPVLKEWPVPCRCAPHGGSVGLTGLWFADFSLVLLTQGSPFVALPGLGLCRPG